mmetsp:Transcript_2577/g.3512  ORF Transcript_2577/g.3512 Transcript_2577/m.3512 type:complete len:115 (-) Transcript_2577:158-502(-)
MPEAMRHWNGSTKIRQSETYQMRPTNLSFMFFGGKSFKGGGGISSWNVSNATDLSWMFFECRSVNGDVSSWEVSNATDMTGMLHQCDSFNRDSVASWRWILPHGIFASIFCQVF